MINKNITCQVRQWAGHLYTSMRQRFAYRVFMLGQYLQGSSQYVCECNLYEGRRTVFYQRGLATTNPAFLDTLTCFANNYDLALVEDRRCRDVPVALEQRRTPSLLAAVLGFALIQHVAYSSDDKKVNLSAYEQTVSEQNILPLLNWIRFKLSELEFEVGYDTPRIKRLPSEGMYKLAFGANAPRISGKSPTNIYGLYNYKDETIYLLDTIELDTTKGRAILLHELVHYLQYRNGREDEVECKNRLEYLAYTLEAAYLKEHGERADFSHDHMRRVTRC